MNCQKCQRQMAPDEPAYRFLFDSWWHMGCKACVPVFPPEHPRRWLDPRPCDRCSRLIYREYPPRKGSRFFACSIECRQAIHNANYRKRHPRRRGERTCLDCGEVFTPKKRNSKFCSIACKQRAYRARIGTRRF
jgi:hypothetical protein